MSNSQALGGGDAPKSLINGNRNGNTDSPSSPWTNLPIPVYYVLGSKMDGKDIRAMRLVCNDWLKNVDHCVGLKVKVDDSIDGNLEFVKRVKVGKARIRKWTEEIGVEPASHLFQYPDWLHKLKLCGKMPDKWKIHELCRFRSLSHLVLRDKAISSNNLTGHQYPVVIFDPKSELSPNDQVTRAYQTQDLPSEAQSIEFKSLKTFEIIRYDYYSNMTMTNTELSTHSYLLMMTNICFILSHVKSPLLKVAHLAFNSRRRLEDSHKKLNWKLAPLHKFLDTHRTSLRELFLPNFDGHSTDLFVQDNLSSSFPVNLKKLMLSLRGVFLEQYSTFQVQTTFVYLQKILEGQTQLQDVHLYFMAFPLKWTSDAFTALANSCGQSLRYLELEGIPDGYRGSLDLQMLSVCHCLEVLHMPQWGRTDMTFTNVEMLPTSIKRLVIREGEFGRIEIGDPNVFKRLTALEWIELFGIRIPTASNNVNQESERSQFCRTMFQGLLGLRQLKGFNLEVVGSRLNRDPILVEMLSPLCRHINPKSQYEETMAMFNWGRGFSSAPCWEESESAKQFDVSRWDGLEKYKDDEEEEEPQQLPLPVPRPAMQQIDNEAGGENDDGENDIEDDQDEDMDLNEEIISSDEDDL